MAGKKVSDSPASNLQPPGHESDVLSIDILIWASFNSSPNNEILD